jgi:hypothetical protein
MIKYAFKNEKIKLNVKCVSLKLQLKGGSYGLLKGQNWTLYSKILLKWDFVFKNFVPNNML